MWLGWFSLFVAVTAVAVAADSAQATQLARDWWMVANWAAWALLWGAFFVLLALGRAIECTTAWLCLAQGVLTGRPSRRGRREWLTACPVLPAVRRQ